MMESSSSGIPDEEASYRGLVFNTPPQSKHTVVVFGKTGTGKSTILNFLQKRVEFQTSDSLESCTQITQWVKAPFIGYPQSSVLLVEIPGFLDTKKEDEHIQFEMIRMLKLIQHGVSVFLFVISIQQVRFDSSISQILSYLGTMMSPEVYSRCKIMFTQLNQINPNLLQSKITKWKEKVLPKLEEMSLPIKGPLFEFDYDNAEKSLQVFKEHVLNYETKICPPFLDYLRQKKSLNFTEKDTIADLRAHFESMLKTFIDSFTELQKQNQKSNQSNNQYLRDQILALQARTSIQPSERKPHWSDYLKMGVDTAVGVVGALAQAVVLYKSIKK